MAKDKVYTAEMGKPPQDIDGKSAGKVDKKDMPEQPGEGIRVDGKTFKDTVGKMKIGKQPLDAGIIRDFSKEKRRDLNSDGTYFEVPSQKTKPNKDGTIPLKNGGMTASSRADGIASKGKTRGKLC
jgi:hypothetical protein